MSLRLTRSSSGLSAIQLHIVWGESLKNQKRIGLRLRRQRHRPLEGERNAIWRRSKQEEVGCSSVAGWQPRTGSIGVSSTAAFLFSTEGVMHRLGHAGHALVMVQPLQIKGGKNGEENSYGDDFSLCRRYRPRRVGPRDWPSSSSLSPPPPPSSSLPSLTLARPLGSASSSALSLSNPKTFPGAFVEQHAYVCWHRFLGLARHQSDVGSCRTLARYFVGN